MFASQPRLVPQTIPQQQSYQQVRPCFSLGVFMHQGHIAEVGGWVVGGEADMQDAYKLDAVGKEHVGWMPGGGWGEERERNAGLDP